MKILYGITKSNFGGAQRYVFDLAKEVAGAGHDVAVLCGPDFAKATSGKGVLIKKLEAEGIRVILIPYLKRDISILDEIKSFFFIIEILRKEKPDVFHTNSAKMGGLGNLVARLVGIRKIIFTSHGWEFNAPRPQWQKFVIMFFSWLTVMLSHQTICVSEKTRDQISRLPFIGRKIIILHNGVALFPLLPRETARHALEIRDDKTLVVGTLSELHPVKGLDILLEAWAKFVKKHNAVLIILGDGEARKNLENQTNKLELQEQVTFKGYVEDAKQYLNAFDIFCLPSRSEAFPYALLEAGMAGLSVIATSVGGIPEIIENSLSGSLIPPEDSEMLFSTLILFAEDEELRKRLGFALHDTVEKKFCIEKMFKKTIALY